PAVARDAAHRRRARVNHALACPAAFLPAAREGLSVSISEKYIKSEMILPASDATRPRRSPTASACRGGRPFYNSAARLTRAEGKGMSDPACAVGIIMGSQSDWETMRHAAETLDRLGIAHESRIISAHRTPDRLHAYAGAAQGRGLKAIIAG